MHRLYNYHGFLRHESPLVPMYAHIPHVSSSPQGKMNRQRERPIEQCRKPPPLQSELAKHLGGAAVLRPKIFVPKKSSVLFRSSLFKDAL